VKRGRLFQRLNLTGFSLRALIRDIACENEGGSIVSTRQVYCAILALTLLLGSCNSVQVVSQVASERTQVGGCILISPSGEVPANLYQESDVVPTDEYKPFTKKLLVYGITLIGRDNITDDFMRNVARIVKEMFPRKAGIDTKLQEEVLRNMYKYRTTIPLIQADVRFNDMTVEDREAWNVTRSLNSVCDSIHENEEGRQVMEVVEHILHHVTDVGLHYTFPEEWAVTSGSRIHELMLEAVEKGYYDDTSYDRIDDEEARLRVKIQELAYIIITTAWDQQVPYSGGGDEWTRGGTIATSDDLKAQFPEAYQLYEETVTKVMAAPGASLLDELFGG